VGPVGTRQRKDCHFHPLEIAYRAGTYSTFLNDLQDQVQTETLVGGEHGGRRPLAKLDLEAYHEWTIGLFKAWAEVGDILTFYQERIANEGYLATAREERSVREIVRLIDHVPAPGVGSTTRLAYRLLDLPGTPEVVVVPERASVTSVPERKEMPQTWETVEELHARREWNALRPRIAAVELRPGLLPSATSLELAGIGLGLEAGSPLLLELGGECAEPVLRRVVAVEEEPEEVGGAAALTRVTLDRPLSIDTEEDQAAVELRGVSTFEQDLALFGRDAPEWADLDDEIKARYAQPLGGVAVTGPGGEWRSIGVGLPEGSVDTVLAGPDGSLYAGTSNGIFRSVDGETWTRSGADLIGNEILTLATDGRQQLFAGTAKNGVLRSSDGESWEVLLGEAIREPLLPLGRGRLPRSGRLPGSPVRAVLPAEDRVFAGTDHGVFVFVQRTDTWQAVNKGLPDWAAKTGRAGVVVQTLLRGASKGELFAGTDKGIFHTADSGRSWQPRNASLPGFDADSGSAEVSVLALHLDENRRTRASVLMAGSDRGVFRSLDGGASWEAASLGLPGTDVETGLSETPVTALVLAEDAVSLESSYFAATGEGLFVSTDGGVYWARVGEEVVSRPVSALAPSVRGGLIAAVPSGGFDREHWPGFRIRDGRLDLMDATPGIEEGDWLVLADEPGEAAPEGETIVELVRAARVRPLLREDFTLEAAVTRVIADRPLLREGSFDLRTTRVLAGTRLLPLPSGLRTTLEPLAQGVVELDPGRRLQPFPGPRNVIVDGKPIRVRFGEPQSLRTDEGRDVTIDAEAEPQVLRLASVGSGRSKLRVRLESAVEGDLEVAAEAVKWRPARDDDAPVAESATATWTPSAGPGQGPTLALRPALRCCFDPGTVRILANVAVATQGKTVYRDVLGSGDATRAHQRFEIAAPPLTYLRSGAARGWASTLEIRVNDIRWREVESLFDATPRDRVYMVRHDIDDVATVIFGDGRHGARLPTGQENVVALYRSGRWLEGVNRGRLTVPETRPLGVDGVTNPLRAAPGAGPETPDRARARVPVALRTLGRIVSLRDYEDFCRTYPGIDRARAADLATDAGDVVQVTIATEDGSPVRQGDELHRALTATVRAARSGRMPLSIDFCRRVPFEIAALVRFDPDRRAADVERVIRTLLEETYSYDRGCFEARVTASDIVRRIGSVPGVVSVQLESFHRSSRDRALRAFLEARPARWEPAARRIYGAELLELRRPGGLTLKMKEAR
jgi:hypothetical protein